MKTTDTITNELRAVGSPEKAKHLSYFFKTGKGQYGEGDLFFGVTVPAQREIAKRYPDTSWEELTLLLSSPVHEIRLTALLILVNRYSRSKQHDEQQRCVEFYLAHTQYINNWDLVDLSCYKLLGHWLADKERNILYKLAKSENMWEQRIAIVSCMHFVKQNDYNDCLTISDMLLNHPHDLIHKAVGWLLRETGKKDEKVLTGFLLPRYKTMPRTMLRYAIEKFPETIRQKYLKGSI